MPFHYPLWRITTLREFWVEARKQVAGEDTGWGGALSRMVMP